jgi:hypothetical protein
MTNARRDDRGRATCRANQFGFRHVASLVTPQKPKNRPRLKTKFASGINLIGIVQSQREKFSISFFPKS